MKFVTILGSLNSKISSEFRVNSEKLKKKNWQNTERYEIKETKVYYKKDLRIRMKCEVFCDDFHLMIFFFCLFGDDSKLFRFFQILPFCLFILLLFDYIFALRMQKFCGRMERDRWNCPINKAYFKQSQRIHSTYTK